MIVESYTKTFMPFMICGYVTYHTIGHKTCKIFKVVCFFVSEDLSTIIWTKARSEYNA